MSVMPINRRNILYQQKFVCSAHRVYCLNFRGELRLHVDRVVLFGMQGTIFSVTVAPSIKDTLIPER